jgi:hypothetical protein
MKRVFAVWAATAIAAAGWGACPAGTTHIVDKLLTVDGVTPAAGTISIYGPSVAMSGGTVVASRVTVTIGAGGAVDFCLVGGPGYGYRATYTLTDPVKVDSRGRPLVTNTYAEQWVAPLATGSLTLRQLLDGVGSGLGLVSPQRINPAGLRAGQGWVWDGSAYVPGSRSGGDGGGGIWGSIGGTLTNQADLANALAGKASLIHVHLISDITSLQATLDAKAPLSHVHIIGDITGLQAGLNAKESTANKGAANGYAPLGADGKVPSVNLPASSGMTAVVQDTAPQLGGDLDMNGHSVQTVTPTEMARLHGVTAAVQTQIDGKAATGHVHTGVYEPVDATILRQANLAGSGAAPTPARSDHNHDATYVSLAGNYTNPGWITSLPYTKISGLGGAATLNVGTTAGTVAAGNDPRFVAVGKTPLATDGNAATASALASTPTLCPTGQTGTGILPNGNATGCAPMGGSFPTVVTPEQFGCVGNGVANDSACIQAAINSLTAGGTVKFAAKTYAVNTLPLTVTVSAVNLVGEGMLSGTTLLTTDTTHDIIQFTGGGSGNCAGGIAFNTISDMALSRTAVGTGNGITVTNGCGVTLKNLFVFDSVKQINNITSGHTSVQNVYANWTYGGSVTSYGYYSDTQVDSTEVRGLHVTCNGANKYGLFASHPVDIFIDYLETITCDHATYLSNAVNDVHLTNSIFDGCNITCFHLNNSVVGSGVQPGLTISGGFFRPTNANAIAFDVSTVNGIVITGTVTQSVAPSGSIGLKLSNVAASVFTDNIVQGVVTGVALSGGGSNIISHNLFFTDSGKPATDWMTVTSASSQNIVSENLFSGTATNGLTFAAGANNNTIRDNTIGVSGTAINNSGTNNRFSGNQDASGVTLDGIPTVNATGCTGATRGTGATNVAGTITGLPTGACSVVLTFGTYKPTTGWACTVSDQTTGNLFRQSANTQTTATFAGTSVSGDVLSYNCTPY